MTTPNPTSTYILNPTSYSLPLLHAAKHTSSTTLGIFLSPSSPSPSSSTSSDIEITEAIPLIHLYTALSPMMEIALEMVEVYAKGRGKGLEMVGIWVVHSEPGGNEGMGLGRVGERLMGCINGGRGFGVVVDVESFAKGENPYTLYTPSTTSSKPQISSSQIRIPSIPNLAAEVMSLIRDKRIYRDVGDWDDHLEDSSVDWLENRIVSGKIRDRFA